MKFRAGVVLTPEQVEELIADGANVCLMQCVETDKNAYRRRENKTVKPDLKSRLVGCGNFEETEGLRTDSPAGDNDSHNLVCSWCASNKVKIESADISSAYLQGREVDGLILYQIRRGGIPEEKN